MPHNVGLMSVEHYENFPVASWLCPPRLRAPIEAVYHFARTADDLADEGDASPELRRQDLDEYAADLVGLWQKPAQASRRWPSVFQRLAKAVDQHGLPQPLLLDLLSAFRQDTQQDRYGTRAELLDYCRRSANPVGRLLLHLYGVKDPVSQGQSDDICTALQLINFWQDPSIDWPRGRCYFPQDDLARHGLKAEDLLAGRRPPGLEVVTHELVAWARELMRRGAPLCKRLPGRLGWELRLVVQGGWLILDRIEQGGCRPWLNRPTVKKKDLPRLLARALRMHNVKPPAP